MIRLGIAVLVILVIVLLIPSDPTPVGNHPHGNKYEVKTTRVKDNNKPNIKQVYMLMDASGSMKGYMDFGKNTGVDKTFPNTISPTMARFLKNYNAEVKVKYCKKNGGGFKDVTSSNLDDIAQKMIKGEDFGGATTELDAIIKEAVQLASDSTISILVSDMVLSLGRDALTNSHWRNQTDLDPILGKGIKNALVLAEDIHVLLLQFYSDFNGDYYYNCTENLENGKHYKGQLMKKRPFYVMVFGKAETLKGLLADRLLFEDYVNFYTSFGLDESDMTEKDFTISFDGATNWRWENGREDQNSQYMGTLWTVADMNTQKTVFYVNFDKLEIPVFVNQNWEIDPGYRNMKVIDNVVDVSRDSEKNRGLNSNQMRFEITLRPFNELNNDEHAEFRLISKNRNWVDDATVLNNDDVNIESIEELECRTWGLSTVLKNIESAYYGTAGRGDDEVARVQFDISKY